MGAYQLHILQNQDGHSLYMKKSSELALFKTDLIQKDDDYYARLSDDEKLGLCMHIK